MVCQHTDLPTELNRLKLRPLQLLLDRKPLKVVKLPVSQKQNPRKRKKLLSLKRVLKKKTLTWAHLRLKKWLKLLKRTKRGKKLLLCRFNSKRQPQGSNLLSNRRLTVSNYNKVRKLAGHPSDPPHLLTNLNQVLNVHVLVATAAAQVAMAVLTEELATVDTAGSFHITLSVQAMVMDLCTRKMLDLLNLSCLRFPTLKILMKPPSQGPTRFLRQSQNVASLSITLPLIISKIAADQRKSP